MPNPAEIAPEIYSAIAGTLVFAATLALAISTWKMARSAKRQADAASELADIARRQLAVSSTAKLRVSTATEVLLTGPMNDGGGGTRGGFYVKLENSGEAPAAVESLKLTLPGGRGTVEGASDQNVLEPALPHSWWFAVEPDAAQKAVDHGGDWTVDVVYHEPGSSEKQRFRALLKAKRVGDDHARFVVTGGGKA